MRGQIEEAWDTALGQPQSRSMTAALTGMFVPCKQWHRGEDETFIGPCDFHYDVWILDLMVKNLDFAQLVAELRSRHGKWFPRRVTIEEKQSGVGLLQVFRGSEIPIRGQTVQQGKVDRAVNPIMIKSAGSSGKPIAGGAASVQGWVKMGRVLVPMGAEWIEHGTDGNESTGFLKRVCVFDGGYDVSDEFDALVHLVTRAITLSKQSGRFASPMQDGPTDEDIAIMNDEDPRRLALQSFREAPMLASITQSPLHGMCMAPCHYYGIHENKEWCSLHVKQTNSLSGCMQFKQGVAA